MPLYLFSIESGDIMDSFREEESLNLVLWLFPLFSFLSQKEAEESGMGIF